MEFPIVLHMPPIATAVAGEITPPTGDGFAELIDALLDPGTDANDDVVRDGFFEGEGGDEPDTNPALTTVVVQPVASPTPAPIAMSPQPAEASPPIGSTISAETARMVADHAPRKNPVGTGGMAEESDVVTSDVAAPSHPSGQPVQVAGLERAPVSIDSPASRPAVASRPVGSVVETLESAPIQPMGEAPVEPSVPPVEETRPGPSPVEPASPELLNDIAPTSVPNDGESGEASVVDGPGMRLVIDRIEEWLEQTGGVEPTTISLELPDPDGDLLVRVALRDGQLELSVIRADGEAPAWFIDRLEEALTGHGFEMAGHRHRQSGSDEAPDQPAPAPSPRRRPRRTDGLWM